MPCFFNRRRGLTLWAFAVFFAFAHAQAFAQSSPLAEASTWAALKAPGSIVLFRHALAPGGGDPPGMRADDCSTQRNLSEEGRQQAERIGQTLRQRGIQVQTVWHSAWCRTRDTAQLAFPELRAPALRAEPAFNSFFGDRSTEPAQTTAARKLLLNWQGPGTLVVVAHQVNITALTELVPQSGEGIVLQRQAGKLVVKGRVLP
jgi:phosphohistidine phosphatase SixA